MDSLQLIVMTDDSPSRHGSLKSSIDSPKKNNLSFTINFANDGLDGEFSNDLKIDVAEVDNYETPKKRCRYDVDDKIASINEMEEEIERQLDAKAAKTNLTATNVKNMIKHVIMNEDVISMVQNTVNNSDEKVVYEPKLTRAKAKELALSMPDLPWHLTPIKKTVSPQMQALVEDDLLHEDSSDDEYHPENDHNHQSEDEANHVVCSDIESEPLTPASTTDIPHSVNSSNTDPIIHCFDDEFKIPEAPHILTQEESIGQRTRSKFCLSETPIEQLEKSFIPPDTSPDLYPFSHLMNDPIWKGLFGDNEQNMDDDIEADPTYNILEDNDINTKIVDKEELRSDKGVKVSKKERNLLYEELKDLMDMDLIQKPDVERREKKRSFDHSMGSNFNNSSNDIMCNSDQAIEEPAVEPIVSEDQCQIIAYQLEQHVQLLSQHFILSYMHPVPQIQNQSIDCKDKLENLLELKETSNNNSLFNIMNLPDAMKLVNDWEERLDDEDFREKYIRELEEEVFMGKQKLKVRHRYTPKFNSELFKLMMNSKALMYPELLPHIPFRAETLILKIRTWCDSEQIIVALGLEKYLPHIKSIGRKFKKEGHTIADAAYQISKELMPYRNPKTLLNWIKHRRRCVESNNPIQFYFDNGYVPSVVHNVPLNREKKAPIDFDTFLLPELWQKHIKKEKSSLDDVSENNAMMLVNDLSTLSNIQFNNNLKNPIICMMPNTPSLDETPSININTVVPVEKNTDDNTDNSSTSKIINVPQLRKTTARLAKIRSVQNMKLMTQVSCSSVKTREKKDSSAISEVSCGSSKGDNEDDIAELMLASTTIKKNTELRKKAKQAKELECIKRMLEGDNISRKEERARKFAESYVQKLQATLESTNPETLKTVIKYYLEYSDKIEEIQQSIQDEQDKLAIKLYISITNSLKDYPSLCSDFLLFLTPQQAKMVNKTNEHTMIMKMSEFINGSQIYFAKQPTRMSKIIQAITQLTHESSVTMEKVLSIMEPLLKSHPLIMDLFLQMFPDGKPPESLFLPSLFENLTYTVGPLDKQKVYTEDSPELYENIELSTGNQEDHYGGDNCICNCHNTNTKSGNTDHCKLCGVKYLNGKVYLQTSEGLRPAKVTFEGDEEEKLDNIARVSMKTSERCLSNTSTGKRKKSTKNDNVSDEQIQKQYPSKMSPVKENDDIDKTTTKTKRGAKSPPKSIDQRKQLKSSDSIQYSINSTAKITSPIKSKREKRAERREAKSESKNLTSDESSSKINQTEIEEINPEASQSSELMDISVKLENREPESPSITNKPWTREEDMVLLQNIQKNYSESTFLQVSELLGDRSVDEVKERCEILLELLQKMA